MVPLLPSSLFFQLTFVNIDGNSGKYILLLLVFATKDVSWKVIRLREMPTAVAMKGKVLDLNVITLIPMR